MTPHTFWDDELREDVEELTALMREDSDFADVRRVLAAQGISPHEAILAGLIGSEDNTNYGVVIVGEGDCFVFETDARGVPARWEAVEDVAIIEGDFRALSIGIEMRKRGQIH